MISIILATLVTRGLGPAHLNFLWKVGSIHIYLSLLHIFPRPFFFVTQIFFLFHLLLVNNIQVMTGAGRTLNLLFSASKYAAFQNSFPDRIWLRLRTAWGFKKYIKK